MAKTKEELNGLKKEIESLSEKLKELSPEELEEVAGGFNFNIDDKNPDYEINIYPDNDPKKDFTQK